ncbi:transposase [bacterium]|nr:transposase [bacterium]
MRHAKSPIALEHLKYNGGTVLYKGKFNKGIKKNFETYEPDDFLAALTSHIPKHRQKYRNFYGVFSNKTRGYNKKNNSAIEYTFPVDCPETQAQDVLKKHAPHEAAISVRPRQSKEDLNIVGGCRSCLAAALPLLGYASDLSAADFSTSCA